jgi:hypothetical protein
MTPPTPEGVLASQVSGCPHGHPGWMASPTPECVLELARCRNVALTRVGDRLKFRGLEAAVAELRPLLLGHKQALLALLRSSEKISEPVTLTGNEPWDQCEGLSLMAEADALVEWLGVYGLHPAIVDAAAMVGCAFATHDLETLRFACAEFTVTVARIANRRA